MRTFRAKLLLFASDKVTLEEFHEEIHGEPKESV